MTSEEMKRRLMATIGVPDDFLSEPEVEGLFDEAFSVLANAVVPARLMSTVSLPLVAGQDQYTVTGRPTRIVSVNLSGVFLQPYTLARLEREAPSWTSESGTPIRYWCEGVDTATGDPKIRVYPTPSASSGTLVVSIVRRPPSIASYAHLEVSHWDELAQCAAVFYAAWRWSLNGMAIVDAEKRKEWFDAFSMHKAVLQGNEDPTSAQAQQAMAEKSWRMVNQ